MISPVLAFAIFTVIALRDGTTLDVSRLFTSLSLILLLTQPLFYVFLGIDQLMSALGCFERIGAFLEKESRSDHRLNLPQISMEQEMTRGNAGRAERPPATSEGIEMATFDRITACRNWLSTPAVLIRDGAFGWTKNGNPILHDINLSVERSKLTILVGHVASGKSTLLKALLGETPSSQGFVHISTREIAWCEQTPWLIVSTAPLTTTLG